jgi:hypothetical protein
VNDGDSVLDVVSAGVPVSVVEPVRVLVTVAVSVALLLRV